jgi:hypothetical protein
MKLIIRSVFTLIACLLLATPAFAARTEILKDFEGETGFTKLDKVTDAIMSAAEVPGAFGLKAKWIFEKVKPGEIVATLFQRQYMAKVTIAYNTKNYTITYKDSSNLNHDGTRIHVNYAKWVGALKTNIDKVFVERRAAAANSKGN